jgi:hypothetical protein
VRPHRLHNNNHNGCPSRLGRAASPAAAAAHHLWTLCTPTRPMRSRSSPHPRICFPTPHKHKPLRMRTCQHTATSSHAYRTTCFSRPRSGLHRHRPTAHHISISTLRRLYTRRHPRAIRRHRTGRHRLRKRTPPSRHSWPCSQGSYLRRRGGKTGIWTFGTRCRLVTSAYSFRFTLALVRSSRRTG